MNGLTLALLAAVFTSLTTILAKAGIKNVNSNFATMFRTSIVIICSFVLCLITKTNLSLETYNKTNIIFLVLSGVATGLSWICYYKALKMASINKVAPIDKSSFILTSVLFLIFFFDQTTNNGNILTIIMLVLSMSLMLFGTLLMIDNKNSDGNKANKKWLIFAILSSVFASLVSLFIKIGLSGIPSNAGTFYRTIIVFIFSLAIVVARKDYKGSTKISIKSWIFLALSGFATGGAWLCEYAALSMENVNPVMVSSAGKLSILLTMFLSFLIFKEKFTKKSIFGLTLLSIGIIIIIVFSL